MSTQEIRKGAVKQIASIISEANKFFVPEEYIAECILAARNDKGQPLIAILDPDQGLPENPMNERLKGTFIDDGEERYLIGESIGWEKCMGAMLKAGWKKVMRPEEEKK